MLDPALPAMITQPIRTCKLVARVSLPTDKLAVTKQHNEKSEKLQPHSQVDTENHGLISRGKAFAESSVDVPFHSTRFHDLQKGLELIMIWILMKPKSMAH